MLESFSDKLGEHVTLWYGIVICINPAFSKMIDGTEKPKVPSKFAIPAARYNKFHRNLLNIQVKFLGEFRRTVLNTAHQKCFFGLREMTFGLVNASYSLPKWQAVKLTCSLLQTV